VNFKTNTTETQTMTTTQTDTINEWLGRTPPPNRG